MKTIHPTHGFLITALCLLMPIVVSADQLDVARNKLELSPTVANNLFFLLDNSGSMDFEILTSDYLSSGLFLAAQPDGRDLNSVDPARQITHRPGCEQSSALFGGYAYGVASPTNVYTASSGANCLVAAADEWRFRNADFNRLYFDPTQTYEPWPGEDINGNDFEDYRASSAGASLIVPLDPYNPSLGLIDLLANNPVTGPFRYYDWNDDGDGDFENGEQQERLIASMPAAIQGNFANWFVYHRSRFLRAKGIIAHALVQAEVIRTGLAVTQDAPPFDNQLIDDVDGRASSRDKQALLNWLYSIAIDVEVEASPVDAAEILSRSASSSSSQLNVGSPLRSRLDDARQYLSCQTSDLFVGLTNALNSSNCPTLPSSRGGNCQVHQLVVVSDGFYNGIRPFPGGNEDASTGGNNLDAQPAQSAFDGGAFADGVMQSLADQAMRAYKSDYATGLQGRDNELIVMPEDRLRYPRSSELETTDRLHQHIKTHVLTFGVSGQSFLQPADASLPFAWQPPAESDSGVQQDSLHTAYNGRGTYVDLTTGDAMRHAVDTLRSSIINPALPNATPITTQAIAAQQAVYRALFDPNTNTGDLVVQSIQTDGTLATSLNWSAAQQLDLRIQQSSDSRRLFTYFDDGSSASEGRLFEVTGSGISATQLALLNMPVPANRSPVGADRLDYLRGQSEFELERQSFDDGDFRERPDDNGRIGPIENSQPVFVGSPSARGRSGGAWPSGDEVYFIFQQDNLDRDPSIYVGSNSGIFHGFDASNGEERFGYVPNLVFAELSQLTRPDYRHRFYVDGTPSIDDVFIRSGSSLQWRTVIVGGLGAGGAGYFALDVTDPNNVSEDSVLWEFSAADDPVPGENGGIGSHLGLSLGPAQIVMTNAVHSFDSSEQQWAAVFGNGVNNTSANGNAVIYIAFLDRLDSNNNPEIIKIDTGVGFSSRLSPPNGIINVRAIDADGNGTADRLYAGDLQGHLFAVDISDSDSSNWNNVDEIFTASLNGLSRDSLKQAIVTRPVVLPHPTGTGYLVAFATGTFFQSTDATDDDIQSIYGIWDDLSGNEVGFDELVEQEFTNRINDEATGSETLIIRTVTDNPVTWDAGGMGWYINLNVPPVGGGSPEFPGERVVGDPVLQGGILFLNTNFPRSEECSLGGGGFNLAINPATGGAANDVVFDVNIDGVFDINDNIEVADSVEVVVGTRNDSAIRNTIFYDGRLGVVNELGELFSIGINTRDDRYLGRRAWREVEDYE